MDKPKFAPNSYQGSTLFMHLTHTTTYIPLRQLGTIKYFYRDDYSKTTSHYDVQPYQGPPGKNQP